MYLVCSKHQGSPPDDQIHLSSDILKFEFFLLVLLLQRVLAIVRIAIRAIKLRLTALDACATTPWIPCPQAWWAGQQEFDPFDPVYKLLTRRCARIKAMPNPTATQMQMALAKSTSKGMVHNPWPRRLQAPALTPLPMHARTFIKFTAAYHHWESRPHCSQCVTVLTPRRCCIDFPPRSI